MKKLYRTSLLTVAAALALVGCNTDYNFDKLSLEVTVGDTEGIVVPLGGTGEIKLSELLTDTPLTPNEEGFYSFSTGDSFSYTVELGSLPSISGIAPEITPTTFEFMGNINASLPTISGAHEVPLPSGITAGVTIPDVLAGISAPLSVGPSTFENTFEVALPEQVASLGLVTFGANGQGSSAEVTFHLNNLADVTTDRTIEEFMIELPAGFTLADNGAGGTVSKGEGSATPNRYTITNKSITTSDFKIGFTIKSLDLSGATISGGKVSFDADVKYGFKFNATTKAGYVSTTMPKVEISAGLSIHSITVKAGLVEHSVEVLESIDQTIDIPAEISRIDYLSVTDAANKSAKPVLNIEVGLKGAPMSKVELKGVKITLPPFIDVEAPQGWTLGSDNSLTRSSLEILNGQTNELLKLTIKGVKNINIASGKATLNGKVGITATASLPQGQDLTLDTSAKSITITPTIKLSDIAIEEVTGLIDPNLADLIEPQEIDLSEISEALGDADIELNLCSPVMKLSVENPIGVGIDAVVKIIAYKGGSVSQMVVTPKLSIKGAVGATPTITNLILSGDASDDPAVTHIDGLSDIINSLPEKLTVELAAETNKDSAHKLILKDSYTFKANYSVDAALMFNAEKEGHINYSTVIEDVDLSSLADIDLDVDKATLNVAAKSTLPMDAALQIEFLDGEGNVIPGVNVTSNGTIKGSTTAEPATSTTAIVIELSQPDSSSDLSPIALLAQTKAVRCTFTGTTLAGGGLSPNQYLSADLTVVLDNGITVDLDSLIGSD
ncbi:MAG: hypothetical protein IIX00_02835, partial [Tidjanibacter sp.]|nr:hypothetical protein [Tidjanibacter sp.]